MTTSHYHQMILDGLKGLPQHVLDEIVDYVYFVRKRALQPTAFSEEIQSLALNNELRELSRNEVEHLDKEFENYEERFPRE